MARTIRILIALVMLSLPAGLLAQTIDDIIRKSGGNFNTIVQRAEAYFALKGKIGTGWKEYNRWKATVEFNLLPGGMVPNMEKMNEMALADYASKYPVPGKLSSADAVQSGLSNWTPMGQQNPTIEAGDNQNGVGSIRCMEWSGSNIWAGAPGGGIWYGDYVSGTTYTWSPRTDGLSNIAITDIEIASTNTSKFYALTGAVGGSSGYRSTGVIKSLDGGVTWNPTQLSFPVDGDEKGYRLLCSNINSNIVWAATTTGLFRTENGGDTWARCQYYTVSGGTLTNMSAEFFEIVYKPLSSTIMYATSPGYFYISSDGGETFLRVNRTTASLPTSGGTRIQIGVTAANTDYIYLLYSSGDVFQSLHLSTNGGSTFTTRSSTPSDLLGSQAWRNTPIAVSPSDATDVYVGGLNVYKSTNSGSTWTLISDQSTTSTTNFCHADIFELYCTSSYLYAATDGGMYRMTRSTDSWVPLHNDMQTAQVYRISVDPTASAAYVLNGTQDNGTYKNSGATYLNVGGADGMESVIRPSSTNVVYVSSQSGGVVRSDDGGSNRTGVFDTDEASGLCGCSEDSRWVTNFTLRPGNDQHIYVGYKAIWYSTNQGVSGWTRITPAFSSTITNIEFAKNNNTIMYATDGSDVARYNLSGSTWTRTLINGDLPDQSSFTRVAVDPNNSSHILISVGGYTSTRKVYETFEANLATPNWTNITRNLPNVPINTVIMDDDAANTIYLGTDIGVFVTNDNRVNWIMFTNGLPVTRVFDLEINTLASPDVIFAGTFGRGVFKAETYTGCASSATLSGTIEGLQYTEVSTTISSSQVIQGGPATSVGYNAGGSITLTEGFNAKAESKFEAYLQGCTSSGTPPRPLKLQKKVEANKPE
ncbi:MAG: 3-coathanger stack domain-containing protein [Bacteroidota bacterium]